MNKNLKNKKEKIVSKTEMSFETFAKKQSVKRFARLKYLFVTILSILMVCSFTVGIFTLPEKQMTTANAAVANGTITFTNTAATGAGKKFVQYQSTGVYYGSSNSLSALATGIKLQPKSAVMFQIANNSNVSFTFNSTSNNSAFDPKLYSITSANYQSYSSSSSINVWDTTMCSQTDMVADLSVALEKKAVTKTVNPLPAGSYILFVTNGNSGCFLQSMTISTATTTSYVVNFNANDGTTAKTTQNIASGSSVDFTSVTEPTRTNYTFDGWYDAATGGNKVTSLSPNSNTELYAHWKTNVSSFASPVISAKEYGVLANALSLPSTISANLAIGGTANFTVAWSTVQKAGGDEIAVGSTAALDNGTYTAVGTVTVPSSYVLTGSLTTTVTAEFVVNAQAVVNYTVNFDAEGGDAVSPITVSQGSQLTLPTPTYTGHTFVGWYTDDNGTGTLVGTAGQNYTPQADGVTLYAKWEINVTSFVSPSIGAQPYATSASAVPLPSTITANLATGGTTTFAVVWSNVQLGSNTPIEISSTDDLVPGTYTANGTLTITDGYALTGSLTTAITATFVVNEESTWTVTFNTLGGDTVNAISIGQGSQITLPTPTYANHTFDGWFDNQSLSGNSVGTAGDSYLPTKDITLYAKWKTNVTTFTSPTISAKEYGILANALSLPSTITANLATSGTESFSVTWSTVQKQGGSAIDISTATALENGTYTATGTVTVPSNYVLTGSLTTTVTAEFVVNAEATWTVTFNTLGGDAVNAISIGQGSQITLPTPTYANHTFDGWFDNQSLSGTSVGTAGASYLPTQDITLYAKWKTNVASFTSPTISAKEYGILANALSLPSTITANLATSGTESFSVTWSTVQKQGGSAIDISTATALENGTYTATGTVTVPSSYALTGSLTTTVTAEFVVSAQQTYLVTFNANGGVLATTSQEVIAGEGVDFTIVEDPSYVGYTFVGWFLAASGGDALESFVPTESITLYAQWTEATSTQTYSAEWSPYTYTNGTNSKTYSDGNSNYNKSWQTTYPDGKLLNQVNGITITAPSANCTVDATHPQLLPVVKINNIKAAVMITIPQNATNIRIVADAVVYSALKTGNFSIYASDGTTALATATNVKNDSQASASDASKQFVSFTSTTLSAVAQSGSTFYLGREGGDSIYFTSIKVTYDLASSSETTKYTVSYDANGGSVSPNSETVVENISVTLPTPTYTGYTFNGWYSASVGGTKIGNAGASYVPTANVTIYAQWLKNVTLTFSGVNGATLESTQLSTDTHIYGVYLEGELITLPRLSKSGYAFVGWFVDVSLETAVTLDSNDKYQILNVDTTLYASWSETTGSVIDFNTVTDSLGIQPHTVYATTTEASSSVLNGYLLKVDTSNASGNPYLNITTRSTVSATRKGLQATGTSTSATNYLILNFNLAASAKIRIFYTAEGKELVVNNGVVSMTSNSTLLTYTYNGTSGINTRLATSAELSSLGVTGNYIAVIERQIAKNGVISFYTGNKALIYKVEIDYTGEDTTTYSVVYHSGIDSIVSNMPSDSLSVLDNSNYTIPSGVSNIPLADDYEFLRWAVGDGDNIVYYQPGDSFRIYGNIDITAQWNTKLSQVEGVSSIKTTEEITAALALSTDSEKWAALGLTTTVSVIPTNQSLPSVRVAVVWDISLVTATARTFVVTGTLAAAPTGYVYVGNLNATAIITVTEVAVDTVTISGGFGKNLVTGENWRSAAVVNGNDYILYNSGTSFGNNSIIIETINGKSTVHQSVPKYVGLTSGSYNAQALVSNIANSALRFTLPSHSTGKIIIRAGALTGASPTIYILDASGTSLYSYTFTSESINDSLRTITVATNGSNGDDNYYVLTTGGTVFLSTAVAEADVELEGEYSVTYNKGVYGTSQVPTGSAPTSKHYYGTSVIFVEGCGSINEPQYHSFSGWQIGATLTKYYEGDVYQLTSQAVTFVANWTEFSKYVITFDVRGNGSNFQSDPIYSGDYATPPTMQNFTDAQSITWSFVGWYRDTNFANVFDFANAPIVSNLTIYAKWELLVGSIDVSVSTVSQRTFTLGVLETEVKAQLPTRLAVQNANSGSAISGVFAAVSTWTIDSSAHTTAGEEYSNSFSTSIPGLYRYIATIRNASPLVDSFDSEADGYSLVNQVITCDVNIVGDSGVSTYEAEYRAYSYTTNPDGTITYNNDSDTYGRNWTQYYKDSEDGYLIIGRNGPVTIGADITTNVGRTNQPTVTCCDDAHAQTAPIVKAGYGTNDALRIRVPTSGVFNTKITVYATRFRTQSSRSAPILTIHSADNTQSVQSKPITAITYTESDYGTDYVDFHAFVPDETVFEYAGGGEFFINVSQSGDNVYITGVRVEYQVSDDTEFATIHYHANNGSEVGNYSRDYVLSTSTTYNAVLDLNSFVNRGYIFVGWATSSSGSKVYDAGQGIMLTSTLDLYAVWSTTDSITYMRNAPNIPGDNESFTEYYSHGVEIAANMFELNGYVFIGWATSSSGQVDFLPGDRLEDITGNIILYAKWLGGSQIIAEYSAYSYIVADSEMLYNNRSSTFNVDWTTRYTESNASGNIIAQNGNLIITANNSYTSSGSRYKPMIVLSQNDSINIEIPSGLSNVRIYVYLVSGSASAKTTVQISKTVAGTSSVLGTANNVALSLLDGSSFVQFRPEILMSYYGSDGLAGSVSIENTSNSLAYISGVRVEAVTNDEVETITYNANNGVATDVKVVNVLGDTLYDINYFNTPGSIHSDGWYLNPDCTGTIYNYGQLISANSFVGNLNLYTKWIPIPISVKYTVYGLDGATIVVGPTISDNTVYVVGNNDRKITEPLFGTPSDFDGTDGKSYALDGWYLDEGLAIKWPLANNVTYDMIGVDGNISIYAKYYEVIAKEPALISTNIEFADKELATVLEELKGVSYTTAQSLGLPSTLTVTAGDEYNLEVKWLLNQVNSIADNGIVDITDNSMLKTTTYGINGTVRLPDELYKIYGFIDENKVYSQQTVIVTANVELISRVIDFPLGDPLPNDQKSYPLGTAYSTIMDNMNIVGRYTPLGGTLSTIDLSSSWACSPEYSLAVAQDYVLSTTINAPRGYTFKIGMSLNSNNSLKLMLGDRELTATTQDTINQLSFRYNISTEAATPATASTGFVRDNMSSLTAAWTNNSSVTQTSEDEISYYQFGSNGGVVVKATAQFADYNPLGELYSMVRISRANAISIVIPAGSNIDEAYVLVEASVFSTANASVLAIRSETGLTYSYSLNGIDFVSGSTVSLAGTSTGYGENQTLNTKKIIFKVSGLNGNGATVMLGKNLDDNDSIYFQKILAKVPLVPTFDNVNTINYYDNDENPLVDAYSQVDNVSKPYFDDALVPIMTADEAGLIIGEGFELAGWTLTQGSTTVNYKPGKIIVLSDSITSLFPVIRPITKTVVFHANYGVQEATANASITQGALFSTVTGAGTINSIETINAVNALKNRNGYTFMGWYTEPSGGTLITEKTVIQVDTENGEYHLFAHWSVKQYSMSFDSSKLGNSNINVNFVGSTSQEMHINSINYESAIPSDRMPTVTKGTRTTTVEGAEVRYYYTLLGWYVDAGRTKVFDLTKSIAQNDAIYDFVQAADTEIVLYAKWGVTVEYAHNIPNYSFPDTSVKEFDVDLDGVPKARVDLLIPPHIERGYEFESWYSDENRTAPYAKSYADVSSDTTIYGNWEPRKCKVLFNYNEKSYNAANADRSSFIEPIYTDVLTAPVLQDVEFVVTGWYLNAECTKEWIFTDHLNFASSEYLKEINGTLTMNLYAKWGVNVAFEINPSVVNFGFVDHVVSFGDAPNLITNPAPSVEGYRFIGYNGYYDVANGIFDYYWKNGETNFIKPVTYAMCVSANSKYSAATKTMTITAEFETNNDMFTISFSSNGFADGVATIPDSQTIINNGNFTFSADIVASAGEYAEFVGWSLSQDGASGIYTPSELPSIPHVSSNIVLYAQWTGIKINNAYVSRIPTYPIIADISDGTPISSIMPKKICGQIKNGETVIYERENILPIVWDLTQGYLLTDGEQSATSTNLLTDDLTSTDIYRVYGVLGTDNGKFIYSLPLQANEGGNYTCDIDVQIIKDTSDIIIQQIIYNERTFNLFSGEVLGKAEGITKSGAKVYLTVDWNSQIDTSISGTHYVSGIIRNSSGYGFVDTISFPITISATVRVTNSSTGGTVNPYVYKMYQDGKLPSAPSVVPEGGYTFVCWTARGSNALAAESNARAGEYTAKFAKLEMLGASIRLSRDYSGLRFSAKLTFSNSDYVRELMTYDETTKSAFINTTMAIDYENGTLGGQNFRNVVIDGADVYFNGVITDILFYNNDGTVNEATSTKRAMEFSPTAMVRLGDSTSPALMASLTNYSASAVAQAISERDDFTTFYSQDQQAMILAYIVSQQ